MRGKGHKVIMKELHNQYVIFDNLKSCNLLNFGEKIFFYKKNYVV